MPIPIAEARRMREQATMQKRQAERAAFYDSVFGEIDKLIEELSKKEMNSFNMEFGEKEFTFIGKKWTYPEGLSRKDVKDHIAAQYGDYQAELFSEELLMFEW